MGRVEIGRREEAVGSSRRQSERRAAYRQGGLRHREKQTLRLQVGAFRHLLIRLDSFFDVTILTSCSQSSVHAPGRLGSRYLKYFRRGAHLQAAMRSLLWQRGFYLWACAVRAWCGCG
jgi:hypothetical protein